MRRALDGNPPISTYFAEPGYGYFGKHAGYDYAVQRWAVRAPEAGTITAVYPNRTTEDGGKIVELRSANYDHRFLHLDSISVVAGQTVSEGQQLGISGNTGNVGFHLHHDVRTKGTAWTASFSNYVDWEAKLKSAPSAGATQNMNDEAGVELYRTALHREPESQAAYKQWNGKAPAVALRELRNSAEWKVTDTKTKNYDNLLKQIDALDDRPTLEAYKQLMDSVKKGSEDLKKAQDALKVEQSKPPKTIEVVKEVVKVVEVPVTIGSEEVITDEKVIDYSVKNWRSILNKIIDKFRRK